MGVDFKMKSWTNRIFDTFTPDGKPNGRIIRVWERGEARVPFGLRVWPGQVYVTTLLPGTTKGPHLHMRRDSLFCCVRGTVRITTRSVVAMFGAPGMTAPRFEYEMITSGVGVASESPVAVYVPAGTPCALYNCGHDEALVVNVSSEPYDSADEHEVLDWRPE